MSDIKNYGTEIQELFLRFLVTDPELFIRCRSIVKPSFFTRELKPAVEFMIAHADEHSSLPTLDQLEAVSGIKIDKIVDADSRHFDWFVTEFEEYCRHKSLEEAILHSTDLLEKGNYGEVELRIKDAVAVGLVKDLGTDYFGNPKERLEKMRDNSNIISTGWRDIDKKLYGGFNRGELNIFAGGSGAGKSLFLQNMALNWAEAGLNVLYASLELSENLCSMRIDSMISGYSTKDIMKNIDDVHMQVLAAGRQQKGSFRIKQLPSGINANDLKAYVKEYEVQTGIKVDAILIDYLDLMMPLSKKVSPSDLFVKDKYVSEELRNLAIELDTLMVTASQLNRGAVDEIEFDHSHISGGISKINTADNVIGIFTSNAMREKGRYQLQFMKTRSSSGVGQKIDLKFDVNTLRIVNMEEEDVDAMTMQASSIVDQLRKKSVITDVEQNTTESTIEKTKGLRDLIKRHD